MQYTLEDFKKIIARLRAEDGCPWDKVQTHQTLKEAMLEEAYEAVDAIEKNDIQNLKEELGDVLLQVVFHSQIEQEQGNFNLSDVITAISEKMITRHPHIFSNEKVDTPQEVSQNWEQIKKKEKNYKTQSESMKNVADALPALIKAQKVQKKAKQVGFCFETIEQSIQNVQKKLQEFEHSFTQSQHANKKNSVICCLLW